MKLILINDDLYRITDKDFGIIRNMVVKDNEINKAYSYVSNSYLPIERGIWTLKTS